MIRRLFVGLAVLSLVLAGGVAEASPTGVTITSDKVYVTVGELVTYDGDVQVCDYPPCREQMIGFGPGLSRLGTPLAEGRHLVKAWTRPGVYQVQFRVTNSRGTNGRATASIGTSVS